MRRNYRLGMTVMSPCHQEFQQVLWRNAATIVAQLRIIHEAIVVTY